MSIETSHLYDLQDDSQKYIQIHTLFFLTRVAGRYTFAENFNFKKSKRNENDKEIHDCLLRDGDGGDGLRTTMGN